MLYDNNKEELLAQIKELKEKLAQKDLVNSNLSGKNLCYPIEEISQLRVENNSLRDYVNQLVTENVFYQ